MKFLLNRKSGLQFPWIGFLFATFCIVYFAIIGDQQLMHDWNIPLSLQASHSKLSIIFVFFLSVVLESIRFQRQKRSFDKQKEKYESQLATLLKGKSSLQTKAHKYADHADKLKLFISDRLLEYIEYDEKFLHFQSIASEVRHNGVISFDKVNTALKQAMQNIEGHDNKVYKEALHSMSYLWDLLDLSTTDNIAMYVANKLYESEEHYYRQMLEEEIDSPYSPTFSTRAAVIHTIDDFVKNRGNHLPEEGEPNDVYRYSDAYFWLDLRFAGSLLGNENYIILMAENLINNALYYQGNRRYGHKYSRIAVKLSSNTNDAILSVYNSGPNISDEIKEEIFQLGFSTKRTKGHHGKGLGLYFVNEIVKGYEGEIDIINIVPQLETYIIRIELDDGSKINDIVDVTLDETGKPVCKTRKSKTLSKEIQYKVEHAIKTIEISVQSSNKTFTTHKTGNHQKSVLLDPQHPDIPHWCIEIHQHRAHSKISFKPLDITGVEFRVLIPTAESRLEADYHELDERKIDELENLNIEFIDTEPYTR